jgi:hypothetical protein
MFVAFSSRGDLKRWEIFYWNHVAGHLMLMCEHALRHYDITHNDFTYNDNTYIT